MRKIIYSIGALLLVAVAAFVWSGPKNVPMKANSASTIAVSPKVAASSGALEPILPIEMMINHKGPLPAERWQPF